MDGDPERALALSYAPPRAHAALLALFALDDRLRTIVRRARDPLIGAMRLTWWADALERLDFGPPPAEPLLAELARTLLPTGVTGAALAAMVDGWERLLDRDDLDLSAYAEERGGRLFAMAGQVLGVADDRLAMVGEGWALAGLVADWPALEARARELAVGRLATGYDRPWPRALRPLGALGLLARFDLAGETRPGSPRRVALLLMHRLTGR